MSDDIVISVENVSKAYRIWQDPGARLKSPLLDGAARFFPVGTPGRERLRAKAATYYRDFYALKDISFQVRKGESVGIIGRNGSGKSTLLQIIAGTLQPTTGSVRVRGRVAALLELGSGFNPDFTGRENVYLNAAVLGLSRAETDAKFESIAAFADIGDFLDQPVKTYSSGMMMRLAFAVQTAVEPDILIVDEALSVGDEAFQRKCFARLDSLRRNGSTILFVSHGAAQIVELCNRAMLLAAGHLETEGIPKSVVTHYHKSLYGKADYPNRDRTTGPTDAPGFASSESWMTTADNSPTNDESFWAQPPQASAEIAFPSAGATIRNPRILNGAGAQVNHLSRGHIYRYRYEAEITAPLGGVRFGGMIKSISGLEIAGMLSHRSSARIHATSPDTHFAVSFDFLCDILPGAYFMNAGILAIAENGEEYFAHRLVDTVFFRVLAECDLPVNGLCDLLIRSSIAQVNGSAAINPRAP